MVFRLPTLANNFFLLFIPKNRVLKITYNSPRLYNCHVINDLPFRCFLTFFFKKLIMSGFRLCMIAHKCKTNCNLCFQLSSIDVHVPALFKVWTNSDGTTEFILQRLYLKSIDFMFCDLLQYFFLWFRINAIFVYIACL